MSDSAKLTDNTRSFPGQFATSRQLIVSLIPANLRGELVRKSLHMLVALLPTLAATVGVQAALGILTLGTLVYSTSEYLRLSGYRVALITRITVLASRGRDEQGFVLGPVTLAIGAMLALLLYPSTAAALAIYALAFGDGIASLVGRAFGRLRHVDGKTVEGSLACFGAVWISALVVTENLVLALIIAVAATLLEALPTGDMDNIILPVGVGLIATVLL